MGLSECISSLLHEVYDYVQTQMRLIKGIILF